LFLLTVQTLAVEACDAFAAEWQARHFES